MRSRSTARLARAGRAGLVARFVAIALTLACALAPRARAQSADPYSRAEVFEGKSQFAEAAAAYTEALARDPAELPALLGLERMDAQLGHLDQFLPTLERAIAAKPQLAPLREAQLRTLRTLGKRAELRDAFERWRKD